MLLDPPSRLLAKLAPLWKCNDRQGLSPIADRHLVIVFSWLYFPSSVIFLRAMILLFIHIISGPITPVFPSCRSCWYITFHGYRYTFLLHITAPMILLFIHIISGPTTPVFPPFRRCWYNNVYTFTAHVPALMILLSIHIISGPITPVFPSFRRCWYISFHGYTFPPYIPAAMILASIHIISCSHTGLPIIQKMLVQ